MFKSISLSVSKKRGLILKKEDTSTKVGEILIKILEDIYRNPQIKTLIRNISYDPVKKSITIMTESKTLASDIFLKIDNLLTIFKEKSLEIEKVIVK